MGIRIALLQAATVVPYRIRRSVRVDCRLRSQYFCLSQQLLQVFTIALQLISVLTHPRKVSAALTEKFMRKQILAIALLAATAVLAHAGEAAKKDPKTGKSCVTFMSSEGTNTGMVRLNYRNICPSAFQISIQSSEARREGAIEAGSPEKPSKTYITCKSDERCEVAKWGYQ
jgi:hypothetical protein